MPYTPTVWVEKVTKVGPTNLNKLENGVQAAAATADAALPTPGGSNGQFLQRVSGLWVPHTLALADLPANIPASQLSGYPTDSTKALLGDGSWAQIANAQVASGAAIDVAKLAGAFQNFTPTWTTTGTAPALGNGTLVGRYIQIGKLVICRVELTAGSTTTFGTGTFQFATPVTSAGTKYFGTGELIDSSASTGYSAIARIESASIFTLLTPTIVGSTSTESFVSATVPYTFATSDVVRFSMSFEAA